MILKKIFERKKKYTRCYIVFPLDLNSYSELVLRTIKEKFDMPCENNVYQYEKLTKNTIKNINKQLQHTCIFILGYSGSLNHENCYKLGLAHASQSCVILIQVNPSNKKIPSYIKCNFILYFRPKNEIEVFELKLSRIIQAILSGNIFEFMYQEALGICEYIERTKKYQIKKISKKQFINSLTNKDVKLYLNDYSIAYNILFEKIIADKEIIKSLYYNNLSINKHTMNYQDFQILVDKNNHIRASSEQGDISGELNLEMNEIELALELIESKKINSKLLKRIGNQLYQALFPNQINARFHATIAGAEAVRLRLIFQSPELAALPWEFLYDQGTNTFLANNTQTALSRYIDVPLQKRDIKTATLPLKVLLVISSPSDFPKLDTTGEEKLIREALAKHIQAGQIELDILPEATIRNINQKLREKPYNIFHFIGHGVFKNNKGYIALVDANGTAKLLDDERFANMFLGNNNLGLIILNSCQGATVSSNQAFAGTAPNLVQKGIPAVVAMQYSILDTTVKLFADEFYRTLALGYPVDEAIQTTRNAISIEVGLDKRDFATPVLYMRAKDGIILNDL